MAIFIRRLGLADSQVYREIRLTSLAESPASFGASYQEESRLDGAGFEALIDAAAKTAFVLGAFDDDALIGICRFTQEERRKTRHRGSLQSMYVRPAYGGQGVGHLLLQQALAEAFANPDIQLILLGVVADNAAANRLYERLGFEEYGALPHYLLVSGNYYTMRFMALKRPAVIPETHA